VTFLLMTYEYSENRIGGRRKSTDPHHNERLEV